jgi:hypothetical protein
VGVGIHQGLDVDQLELVVVDVEMGVVGVAAGHGTQPLMDGPARLLCAILELIVVLRSALFGC